MDNTNEEFNIPEFPLPADECPLNELIGKRVTEMTDAELEAHVKELRSAVESPQSMRKLLANHASVRAKGEKKTAKPNLDLLGI